MLVARWMAAAVALLGLAVLVGCSGPDGPHQSSLTTETSSLVTDSK
jgi:hypothetical protein